MSRLWVSVALLLVLSVPALGHEPDQFTYPDNRQFADMGPYLTRYFYGAIDRGVKELNARIKAAAEAGDRKTVANLQTPDTIAHAVNGEFPVALFLIESVDATLTQPEARQHYPGRICDYKLVNGDIRKYVGIPFSPFNAWKAGNMKVFGCYVGADKIGHFTDMGMHYFDTYRAALSHGKSEQQAIADAIHLGTDDPVYSEKGLLGWATAGAYSNGDLIANYTGFLFYRNLSQPVMIKGKVRSPMVVRQGEYWKIAPRVTPASDFYSLFISDHLNEALNPSDYLPTIRGSIRRAIAEQSTGILEHYTDRFGNRRSPEWFRAREKELSTYYGQYYGHLGDRSNLLLISNVCFGMPPDGINARDKAGRTPLHIAAEAGNVNELQTLIDRGAKVNVQVRDKESRNADWGDTPLHLAANEGKLAAVRFLMAHGANVNAANDRGITPLHLAHRFPQIAQALLGAGARVDAQDGRGRTPLEWAAADPKDVDGQTVAVLLRAGARIDHRDHQGRTALAWAASTGNAPAALALVRHGANMRLADNFGATPLHLAATAGDCKLVDLLIRADAPVNAADDFGCTPLHDATQAGSPYAVALLLRAGANPRAEDDYGNTPLHLAGRFGNETIAQMLLAHGASTYARSSAGLTPADEAMHAGADGSVSTLGNKASENGAEPAASISDGR